MSEENVDVIADENKIVAAHNIVKAENASLKVEKDKLEKELNEMREEKQEVEEKKDWKKEADDIKKELEEIKANAKKAEDDTVIRKGVVTEPQKPETEIATKDKIKSELDAVLPDRKVIPEKFASGMARYGHYKNPATKEFSHEDLGMAISLQASALAQNPGLIPHQARKQDNDHMVIRPTQ